MAEFSQVDKVLGSAIDRGDVPGVVAMAAARDGVVYQVAFGRRALADEAAMSTDTSIVAYSAVCTHTGCDVTSWHPDRQLLECPCHFSLYDPREGAKVVGGPSPRRLPALPLKNVEGRLVVAKPFTGRAGFQQM